LKPRRLGKPRRFEFRGKNPTLGLVGGQIVGVDPERTTETRAAVKGRMDDGCGSRSPVDADPNMTKPLQRVGAADIPCVMCAANDLPAAPHEEATCRRLARRIVVTIAPIFAVLGLILPLATPAQAQSPLIQGWLYANSECKDGPADSPKTQKACETRDRLGAKLKRRGCVYQEDGDWWRCRH